MGMCQTCYFLDYKKKRALKQQQKQATETSAVKVLEEDEETRADQIKKVLALNAESVI